ncbi:Protein of unknown function [Gryllus bimaculatus]|nr:Protein of unknown function [Gryllus bimaculatus]
MSVTLPCVVTECGLEVSALAPPVFNWRVAITLVIRECVAFRRSSARDRVGATGGCSGPCLRTSGGARLYALLVFCALLLCLAAYFAWAFLETYASYSGKAVLANGVTKATVHRRHVARVLRRVALADRVLLAGDRTRVYTRTHALLAAQVALYVAILSGYMAFDVHMTRAMEQYDALNWALYYGASHVPHAFNVALALAAADLLWLLAHRLQCFAGRRATELEALPSVKGSVGGRALELQQDGARGGGGAGHAEQRAAVQGEEAAGGEAGGPPGSASCAARRASSARGAGGGPSQKAAEASSAPRPAPPRTPRRASAAAACAAFSTSQKAYRRTP